MTRWLNAVPGWCYYFARKARKADKTNTTNSLQKKFQKSDGSKRGSLHLPVLKGVGSNS